MILLDVYIFLLGLIFGSFANVLIWRIPVGMSILGRSVCPHCKNKIAWFDNVPLLSFILLKGKCRHCQNLISWRYPAVEMATGLLFLLSFLFLPLPFAVYLATLSPILVAIFVIDLKHQIIPDQLVFAGLIISGLYFWLVTGDSQLYGRILAGLAAALFLLGLHLFTRGRGMGLGDVKFALLGGVATGFTHVFTWMLVAFLTGAVVGVILILAKKSKLKSKIAFGPFLVFGLLVALLFRA